MINKDIATPSQWLQQMMSHIHPCSVCILYKPGLDLHITDKLSQNKHMENKEWEITGINLNVNAICTAVEIPIYTFMEDI